ncbi:MAG: aminoacyl-tRNA hydrolase [Clostridia bacterium]|nr:aminoacyl-tRNA hydrolase [Clostridia bacterium]
MDNYLIAGLGNPGFRYRKTRHNMGFMALDYVSEKYSVKIKKLRCRALTGEFNMDGAKIILAKPQTYMNVSGESIRDLLEYYDLTPSNLIVIYDDLDIPLGKIRIRKKGGSGTHNGMKSILYHIATEEFIRIRIGISASESEDTVRYVLSRFAKNQREAAFDGIENAAMAAMEIVSSGIDVAMNKYNK